MNQIEQVKSTEELLHRYEAGERLFAKAFLCSVNLSGADLSGAILSGADLSGADLSGTDLSWAILSGADLNGAILSGADLTGALLILANLSGAILSEADLSNAILSGADLSNAELRRAFLSGANFSRANLSNANLRMAKLTNDKSKMSSFSLALINEVIYSDVTPNFGNFIKPDLSEVIFIDLNFSEANLSGADLREADLDYSNFSNANLSNAELYKVKLREADLSRADLHGAKFHRADLFGADLFGANLFKADLHESTLTRARLSGVDLRKANLSGAMVSEANLNCAILSMASLSQAILSKVDLRGADLSEAFLLGADLHGADLSRADLSGADLSRVNLRGAKLNNAKLNNAKLGYANLIETSLRGTSLRGASLHYTTLHHVNLSHACLDHSKFESATFNPRDLENSSMEGVEFIDCTCGADVNFLSAKWELIKIDDKIYKREDVESGEDPLPFGMGKFLRFIFESKRDLTGDEIIAARDLIRAFGSVSKSAKLLFELSTSGERFTVTSFGNYEVAAQVGLGILKAAQTLDLQNMIGNELSRQLNSSLERFTKDEDDRHRQSMEMHNHTRETLAFILSFIKALVPITIIFPNKEIAEDFKKVAAEADIDLNEVNFEGPIVRFKKGLIKRLTEIPETAAMLCGVLAQCLNIPGGFAAGYQGLLLFYKALTSKKD